MQYKYRWYYAACAAVTVIIAMYFFDINNQLQRYLFLIREVKNTQEQLAQQRRKMTVLSDDLREVSLPAEKKISDFSQLLHAFQVEILALTRLDQDEYQLILRGDFDAMMQLFLQEKSAYELKNIEIFSESSQRVHAEMRVHFLQDFSENIIKNGRIANPFCGSVHVSDRENGVQFSPEDVQILGVVWRDNKHMKLTIQPDGVMREMADAGVEK